MFKQRLLTTLILIPAILGLIYYAPPLMLAAFLLLLVAWSAWEWTQLIPLTRFEYKLIYLVLTQIAIWFVSYALGLWLAVGLLCWAVILFAVVTYPRSQSWWGRPIWVGLLGLMLLAIVANVFMGLYQHPFGKDLIVYVMSIVWAADIGAYIAGKQWGRIKLIPLVSPGKTIEGCVGGLILAMLVAIAGFVFFKPESSVLWFASALLTASISILGDLLISLLKRRSHLKDSGHLIPGHGGILDRLDSSFAALPLFFIMLSFLELGR